MEKKYGFKKPIIDSTNHVLGVLGSPKIILNPSRDWTKYLPAGEQQKRHIETSSCTEFGTLNAIETLENLIIGDRPDYSERFVAIGSGNAEDGNDPHIVAEWIRGNGLIAETELPFNDSINSLAEYFSPKPLTQELLDSGSKWRENFVFKHEYVFQDDDSLGVKQKKLLEALQYSPVCVSVAAWRKNGDEYIKLPGDNDNHWTLLVAGEEGKQWTIYDSYLEDGDYIKKLNWNYDFGTAKLYILNHLNNEQPIKKKGLLAFLLSLLV